MTIPVAKMTSSMAARGRYLRSLPPTCGGHQQSREAHVDARASIMLPGEQLLATGRLLGALSADHSTRAQGPYLCAIVDGHPLPRSHSTTTPPWCTATPIRPIVEAAHAADRRKGTGWAAGNPARRPELAGQISSTARVPAVEQVRFHQFRHRGRRALAFTIARRRSPAARKLLMARYGYHGSLLEFECGSFGREGPLTLVGDATTTWPTSKPCPGRARRRTLPPCSWSRCSAPAASFTASTGLPAGRQGRRPDKAGALFVLDEVLTLRFAIFGGCQGVAWELEPDLTMFGKLIGGGYPVGAVGGARDLLRIFDPGRPEAVPHRHVQTPTRVTMVAGGVALNHLTA